MIAISRNDQDERQNLAGMSSSDISDHNIRTIIAALRESRSMSRRGLAAKLGLTETAISAIVRRMESMGYIRRNTATKGVRGATYSIAGNAAAGIGIRITDQALIAALVNLDGTIVEERVFKAYDALTDWIAALGVTSQFATFSGIAFSCANGLVEEAVSKLKVSGSVYPLYWLRDTEAALWHQRLLADVKTDNGIGVILVDDTVRAGTMFSDRFFRGAHGRAGALGAMRSSPSAPILNDVAGTASYYEHVASGRPEEEWIKRAASRLLDAIIAIAGFLSPASIAIGGTLPDAVMQRIVDRIVSDKALQESYFIATKWTPEIDILPNLDEVVARGAGMFVLKEALLPLTEAGRSPMM